MRGSPAPPRHVVVIGGGFAGLSCAVSLAGRGVQVTLLEARREAGGRATSFTDMESGDEVDNGQHLFMACYHATRAFLTTIGAARFLRFQRRLTVDYLEPGRRSVLRAAPLPSPWHLVAGVLALKPLSWRDRAALIAAGPALRRLARDRGLDGLESISVETWLDRLGQTPELRRRLWHPLAIATLNAAPAMAPASLMACVLKEGFLAGAGASRLGVATTGLSSLYVRPAMRWLAARGARVITGAPVTHLSRTSGPEVRSAVLRDGTEVRGDVFVSAVPPEALRRLDVPIPGLERFVSSPILSINLWPERPLASLSRVDFAAMPAGHVQWIFNKHRLLGRGAGHLAAVISAAGGLADRPNEDLARLAWDELGECLPEARGAGLRRWLVVRERAATFTATLETEPLRPGPRSPWPNLLLAGDWTMRGIPATIEAAVRSGQMCARMVAGA